MTDATILDTRFQNPAVLGSEKAGIAHWKKAQNTDPDREARANLSLSDYGRWKETYFRPVCDKPSAPFHAELLRVCRNRLTIAPRGHSKSTNIAFFRPILDCVEATDPEVIVLMRDSEKHAIDDVESIRVQIESNAKLQRDFEMTPDKRWWGKEKIVFHSSRCPSGHAIIPLGWGQSIRGIHHLRRRPTKIIVDDPEDLKKALSPTLRTKTLRQFCQDVMPAGKLEFRVDVVGTMIDERCLVGMLSRNPAFTVVRYPAIITWPTRMDLWDDWAKVRRELGGDAGEKAGREFFEANRAEMERGAEVLWPAMYDIYALMCIRFTIGVVFFDVEYQGVTNDPTTAEFNRDLIQRVSLASVIGDVQSVIFGLDSSLGKKKTSDPSAIIVIGILKDGRIVVMHVSAIVRNVTRLVRDLFALWGRYKPMRICPEADSYQELLLQIIETESKATREYLPLSPVYTEGVPKITRIRRLPPLCERGTILISDGPGCEEFWREMGLWRAETNAEDHSLDALEMAVRGAGGSQSAGVAVVGHAVY